MHVGHVPISALIMWLYIILLLSSERRSARSPHRALDSVSLLGDADGAGSWKGGQTLRWWRRQRWQTSCSSVHIDIGCQEPIICLHHCILISRQLRRWRCYSSGSFIWRRTNPNPPPRYPNGTICPSLYFLVASRPPPADGQPLK